MTKIQGPNKIIIAKENNKKKVFLGGTCSKSTWRDDLLKLLDEEKVSFFNPVVKNWTPEDQKEEIRQRNISDYVLFVITPKMTGVYSIAELVDDSNKQPDKTLFCYLKKDEEKEFDESQTKSLDMVVEMVEKNGGRVFENLKEIAEFLNKG